jgi:hypothetical protein
MGENAKLKEQCHEIFNLCLLITTPLGPLIHSKITCSILISTSTSYSSLKCALPLNNTIFLLIKWRVFQKKSRISRLIRNKMLKCQTESQKVGSRWFMQRKKTETEKPPDTILLMEQTSLE